MSVLSETVRRAERLSGRGFGSAALLISCTLAILAPAMINGRPFLFADSEHYFMVGRAIVESLLGPQAASVGDAVQAGTAGAAAGDIASAAGERGSFAAGAGGRSPVYSLLLYLASAKASMWLVLALQAGIVAWLLVRFFDFAWGGRRPWPTFAAVSGASVLTSLGFHAGFATPDIFAAVFVLAAARLAFDPKVGRAEAIALAVLIAVAFTMHATILVLGAVTAIVLALFRLAPSLRTLTRADAALWIGAGVVAAVAFGQLYVFVGERLKDERMGSPPYIMARVIADGPGERLLDEACTDAESPFAACTFAGYRFTANNDFLYGSGGAPRNFATSSVELKHALQDEEIAFVAAAVARSPLEQLVASTRNFATQLVKVGVEEIHYGAEDILHRPGGDEGGILLVTPGMRRCLAAPESCPERKPLAAGWNALVTPVNRIGVVAFFVVLAGWLNVRFRPDGTGVKDMDGLLLCGLLLALLLVANAALCGVLSGAHDRYQARLAWLAVVFLTAAGPVYGRLAAGHGWERTRLGAALARHLDRRR